jgi:hypothetical protein
MNRGGAFCPRPLFGIDGRCEMTLSNFIAEASHYAASAHYRSRGVRAAGRIDSILAQQLCRQLGESCGGIDLICCPGLTCTAGLGGQGIACRKTFLAAGRPAAKSATAPPRRLRAGNEFSLVMAILGRRRHEERSYDQAASNSNSSYPLAITIASIVVCFGASTSTTLAVPNATFSRHTAFSASANQP